ncbi:MAG: ATP-dependent Clp protease ATP-binding subunit ClpA [Acidobacteria bacterium]|nr:ATP-dependent Clp protease ATP-binding subunit ClpA [Acidobacteriota bacterium]
MEIQEELNRILAVAFADARGRRHEYLTAEHIFYASLFFASGAGIIDRCGGNVELMKKELETYLNERVPKAAKDDPTPSLGFQDLMERAVVHSLAAEKKLLEIGDLYAALLEEKESFAAYLLQREGISRFTLLRVISHGMDEGGSGAAEPAAGRSEALPAGKGSPRQSPLPRGEGILQQFTRELTDKARAGESEPLIGREEILERTLQVLCRRFKNNPIHVGDAGVGKTAITEGLAQRVVQGKVPPALKDIRIYALDLGGLLAGTRYRGDFEERLKKVLAALQGEANAVLFIDEVHAIIGAGAVSGGSLDAANILKPVLTQGRLRCIGTTTHEEYKKYFEKDRALSRRFQKIEISEPSIAETYEILRGLRRRYEEYHQVTYADEVLRAAAELSGKYINDRFLPDKAIDVIDEAGALARMKAPAKAGPVAIAVDAVEQVVSSMAKIPRRSVSTAENRDLQRLEQELKSRIFGQDEAVAKAAWAIKRSRAGFRDNDKPVAKFLFVGPTGVGKTELARQLADVLGVPLLRFDMSEYQEKHTVSRLVGSPPGYVGYEEGGLLTDAVRKAPYAVLLLDEIEKAHADIFNTLLQVMDYATLTDNSGRKADFRNVVLIMTSNAGAKELGRAAVGFQNEPVSGAVAMALEKLFSPEFRNRLDAVITFRNLDEAVVARIVARMLGEFSQQLKEKGVALRVSPAAVAWVARRGFSRIFGAREVSRLVQEKIKNPFVDEVLFGRLRDGGLARIDVVKDELAIKIADRGQGKRRKAK